MLNPHDETGNSTNQIYDDHCRINQFPERVPTDDLDAPPLVKSSKLDFSSCTDVLVVSGSLLHSGFCFFLEPIKITLYLSSNASIAVELYLELAGSHSMDDDAGLDS